jgi:short-subunit dehydrogenase
MMRPALLTLTLLLLTGPLAACATTAPMQREGRPVMAGQTVVITGASSGFGRGIATAMAARGANVVLAARRTELLEAVAAEARAAGGRALVVTTDVSKEADMARLAEAAVAEFGRVDVWINNAGVGALGRFDETPIDDHSRIVDVNLKGVMYGSHHALRRFRAQGHGTLINMGSVVSQVPMPYYASYVSTKHAVLGLSEALNQELRANGERSIRVVTVMPWAADTPWFDQAANYSGRRPAKIMPDAPETIVNAVVAAAMRPRDRVAPGLKAKGALVSHRLSPSLSNAFSGRAVHAAQQAAPADAPTGTGSLYQPQPAADGVRGENPAFGVPPTR